MAASDWVGLGPIHRISRACDGVSHFSNSCCSPNPMLNSDLRLGVGSSAIDSGGCGTMVLSTDILAIPGTTSKGAARGRVFQAFKRSSVRAFRS